MGTGPVLTGIGRVAHSRMHGSTGRASQRRNLHPRAGVENSAQPVVGQGDGPAGRMRFASVQETAAHDRLLSVRTDPYEGDRAPGELFEGEHVVACGSRQVAEGPAG